jgi:hypothetical protein
VFNVGGSVTGLIGSGLVLQNNTGNNLTISGSGNVPFTFTTPLTTNVTYTVTVLTQPTVPTQTCSVVNGTGTINGNVTNVQITCSQPTFTIGGSVVGLVPGPGNTLELQNNAGDDLFVTGNTSFTFPHPVTNQGIYLVSIFLPPTSQPQPCNEFFYTGIATTNVSDVIVDCQHNDWNWISWYLPPTKNAGNYASVTTPLFPSNEIPPVNSSTPGGRDFAAAWTDKFGRKWLFGGQGYPFVSPLGKQLTGFLNDLWVFDGTKQFGLIGPTVFGGWVPANLPIFQNHQGDWEDDFTVLERENVPGVYGTLHSATGGAPGSRWGSSTWTDPVTGNLWMLGGQGIDDGTAGFTLLNDVWEWIPDPPSANLPSTTNGQAGNATGQWIWQAGSSVGNQPGVYGTKGTASSSNIPGGRWAAATFTDNAGNVWLFGGQGVDSTGAIGILADLWEYNTATQQWTWVSGSNLASPNGVYGTKGTAAAANSPGGRQAGVLWVDSTGTVWLFAGFGFDSTGTGSPEGAILNDLWKFSGGQWTWVSGDNLADQNGVYGTQTTAAAANVPGSRWGAVGWTDVSNNLWFYGGWGLGSVTTHPNGFLDDIWEYQNSTQQWIWWKGSTDVNESGQYLTNGIPYVKNVAGARRGAAIWQPDSLHYVWIFGGEGYDSSNGSAPGYLDDLWTYLPFP